MRRFPFGAMLLGLAVSFSAGGREVEVTGNRVNLRVSPREDAEVPGQVNRGDRLALRHLGPEWVEVAPPNEVSFWVHRDFVADGVVSATSLNVRAGPGIAHQPVGQLQQGDRVSVRDVFGEWLQIAPPEGVSLWVSRAFVQEVRPPPPVLPPPPPPPVAVASVPRVPDPPEVAETETEPRPVPVSPVVLPRAPEDLDLADGVEQGLVMEREGVVRRVGFLVRRPSRYRLVQGAGRSDTVVYLRGDDEQLEALAGLAVRVRGRAYTTRTHRYPVLLADQISVLP